MMPVFQTILQANPPGTPEQEWGNCFSACVASLLECPVEGMPNFHDTVDGMEWWQRWNEWLYERYRCRLSFWEPGVERDVEVSWWIATHNQGPHNHSTVWYGDRFVHNPWPGAAADGSDLGPVIEGASVFCIATFPEEPKLDAE
jgi:hypothetical protein